jgi:hypothetical protein
MKTILRNPGAVSAKIEDLTAYAEAVNNYGNEPTVFVSEKSSRQLGSLKIPGTESIKIREVKLPKNKSGQQILSSHVRDLARKRGITFDEAVIEVQKFYGAR